jgi:type II secretory pathway pseudopilin PulG
MIEKLTGLTLIEVVLIMTVMAVFGVMTVPQYVAAADEASADAKWEVSVAAKNSQSALTEQTGSTPTVIALAEQLSVTGGMAVANGIQVKVDGGVHTIPTYTNSLCNKPTQNVNDQVGCVGAIH